MDVAYIIKHYGYFAIAAAVCLEDFGVPLPGETILIAGAVAAGSGRMNIWLVLLAGFLGAVVGDNIGYEIGRQGGHRLVRRWGARVGITRERFEHASAYFRRWGDAVIVGARFVEILRQLNGIIAGTLGMPWHVFVAYNALGAALWVGVWTAAGYFVGEHVETVRAIFHQYTYYVLLAATIAYVGYRVFEWAARRRHDSA